MNAFLYASASLAVVLAIYLATSSGLPKKSLRLLAAAVLTIAILNLLSLLQFSNADHPILLLRPGLAAAFPALLFLHIAAAARPGQELVLLDALHVLGPLAAISLRFAQAGQSLDLFIVGLQLFYLTRIAWVSRRGAGSFENLGAPLSVLFNRWRRLVMSFLMFVILLDLLITFEIGDDVGAVGHQWVFGLTGIVLVLGLSYLLVSSLHRKGPLTWASNRYRTYSPGQESLLERLEAELTGSRAFLDANLTLQRFARRVGVPKRDVSAAINDGRNCNYNHWLNRFRICEAQRLMEEDPNLGMTDVMFAAGFQNKSTFNAAFRAIAGQSPTAWRDRSVVADRFGDV